MRIRLRTLAATLAIAGTLAARSARAEGALCPAPDDAPLVAARDAQQRLDFLAQAFDEEIRDTDKWSWTLGTVFAVGGVTQAAVLPLYTHDRATSIDLTVGAVSFGIGAVSLFLTPLQVTVPLRSARRQWNAADRCAVLARAERTLVKAAKEEASETGWFPHVANFAVNAAAVLILAFGYGHGQQATFSGGIGFALGEGNIFTQPRDLQNVLLRYRSGDLDVAPVAAKLAWSVVPVVSTQVSSITPIVAPPTSGAAVALSW
jgi:hypothetical protein